MSGRWRWSLSSRRTLLGSWQKAKTSSTGSGPTAGSGYLATSKLGASVMGLSKWVGQSFTEYERENKLLLSHPNWQRSGGGGVGGWGGVLPVFLQRFLATIHSCTRPHIITINVHWYSEMVAVHCWNIHNSLTQNSPAVNAAEPENKCTILYFLPDPRPPFQAVTGLYQR